MFSEVLILWFKCLVQFACLQAQLAISLLRSIIVWSLLPAALWGWFLGNMLQWLRSHQDTVFSYSVQPLFKIYFQILCNLHCPLNRKPNIYLKYISSAHYFSTLCTTFIHLLLEFNFYKHNLCIIVNTLILILFTVQYAVLWLKTTAFSHQPVASL
jgi:hypothetical protein